MAAPPLLFPVPDHKNLDLVYLLPGVFHFAQLDKREQHLPHVATRRGDSELPRYKLDYNNTGKVSATAFTTWLISLG